MLITGWRDWRIFSAASGIDFHVLFSRGLCRDPASNKLNSGLNDFAKPMNGMCMVCCDANKKMLVGTYVTTQFAIAITIGVYLTFVELQGLCVLFLFVLMVVVLLDPAAPKRQRLANTFYF